MAAVLPVHASEFLADVEYLPGSCNITPDTLSHAPVASVSFGIELHDLSLRQQSCPETHAHGTFISVPSFVMLH